MTHEPAGTDGGSLLVRAAALADWSASDDEQVAAGRRVDVRITGGRITEVAQGLRPGPDEPVLDASGAVVLPGLHDHHLHLRSLVAARRSVSVGPDHVSGRDELAAALRASPVDRHGWRRAVGYHESAAGALDRWSLDALVADAPVRVQHRSGVLWMVNSAGAAALDLDAASEPGIERDRSGRPTGRLFRMDGWLARRLQDEDPIARVDVVSRELAGRGVTGVTDATPDATAEGLGALVDAVAAGRLLQRLHVMCPAGARVPAHALVSRGPHKVLLDDDRLPPLQELVALFAGAHGEGVPVAVHCVTAPQLVLAVTAFSEAGVLRGDRAEHASVVHPTLAHRLAALGVAVVTNPGLVRSRGDSYLDTVEERDVAHLYPCATLLGAGVAVAAGSDAPFGPLDPWAAVAAARTRRTAEGRVLAAHEVVPLASAVGLFTGRADAPFRARRVAAGEPGDLCVLAEGRVPGPDRPGGVLATIVAGRVVYRSG